MAEPKAAVEAKVQQELSITPSDIVHGLLFDELREFIKQVIEESQDGNLEDDLMAWLESRIVDDVAEMLAQDKDPTTNEETTNGRR